MSNPESPRQILGNAVFKELLRRVDFHGDLLRRVKASLPHALAIHCKSCVATEDGGVIVYTDSQAFASQLRFHAPALLESLNAAGDLTIKHVQVRNLLSPIPSVVDKPMAPMSKPTPEIIELVRSSSECAVCDELGQALARLSATMERYARKDGPDD